MAECESRVRHAGTLNTRHQIRSRGNRTPGAFAAAHCRDQGGNLSPLSKNPLSWLPAAEIRGEGIFLRFRTEAIDAWIADNPGAGKRAAVLDAHAVKVATRRRYEVEYQITPRLLVVHSFAHAMIRQLSIDCGYSSAALRERLYVAESSDGGAMNGVLIYTGSPDSEGSLGGLVRLADPALIADAVIRAVHAARWCGSDPVCLEADPHQSGERISGAACHCCLLVPETACEKFNRELDRSMLVGASATPGETDATYDTVPPVKSLVRIIDTNHYGIIKENNPEEAQPDLSAPGLPQPWGASQIAQAIAVWLRWHLTDDPLAEYWYTNVGASLDGVVEVIDLNLGNAP